MINTRWLVAALALLPMITQAGPLETQLKGYQEQGAGEFSAEAGAAQWRQTYQAKSGKGERSCADCHGVDLTQAGKHAKTGKRIEPMAPSVNQKRFQDGAKIEKWFKRNCKWTLGRACTAQEKGDFLSFLQQQ
jgi:mono/diheme cytochrome c family protein